MPYVKQISFRLSVQEQNEIANQLTTGESFSSWCHATVKMRLKKLREIAHEDDMEWGLTKLHTRPRG